MRLPRVEHGHRLREKLKLILIRIVGRRRVPDVVKTIMYRSEFWGRPMCDWTQAVMRGINAAVVGLLLAALYHPVWTSAIHAPADFGLALAAFGLLTLWSTSPWLVVAFAAVGGSALAGLR